MKPIVLASGSPRRKQLLEMLRIPFRVIPPDVDEHVLPGEEPGHYVTRLSRAKAEAVVSRAPGEVILAADTTVVLDGAIQYDGRVGREDYLARRARHHRLGFGSGQTRHVRIRLLAWQHVFVHVRRNDAERNAQHFEELLATGGA